MSADSPPPLLPWDVHNQTLVANVHPADWVNPRPADRYNLVVLGGGTAGLVAASVAAGLGARVALVERHLLGGDCLNFGCVPSKALIRAARAVDAVRGAGDCGVVVPAGVEVDFTRVMERLRRLRAGISPHDSAQRFTGLGVDVFLGDGRFTSPETVEVGGAVLRFAKAVIATGARAAAPSIPGLDQVPYLTHETLFSLTELPSRLGVLGAGPIGCEMAQCFARFGSKVVLIESTGGLLPRDDRDAAACVRRAMERDGVTLLGRGRELRVEGGATGIRLRVDGGTAGYDVTVDRLLVATGRAPNVEGLGLEAAGVAFDRGGIQVNDRLQTTHPRVYACGDVCSAHQFTHAADFMARLVIRNALFAGRGRVSALKIPWCTYTSPELAQVGHHAGTALAAGIAVDSFTQEFRNVDRAVLDGDSEGFVRVHVRRGTDRLVGATVVGPHAGDLIGELTLAMNGGLGLKTLGTTIHPYPTYAEALRKTGDLFNRARLTPVLKGWIQRWMSWQR